MTPTKFTSRVSEINKFIIIKLPAPASELLPSRGLAMGEVTINNHKFTVPFEPDGKKGHWFAVDQKIRKATNLKVGDSIDLTITPIKDWPEPTVPSDIKKAITNHTSAQAQWLDITTKARWDWIRWIRSTQNPTTRTKRINTAVDMLKSGKRNPCCFNRSLCTIPEISKTGILLSPPT